MRVYLTKRRLPAKLSRAVRARSARRNNGDAHEWAMPDATIALH